MTTTTTTTTETTRVYSDAAGNSLSASDPGQPSAPPPTQTQHRVVTNEPSSPAEGKPGPAATPPVARKENVSRTQSTNSSNFHTTSSSQSTDFPYGKPVPGKPGYVYSPFDKNGGYVDVTGYTPGQKVKDPYSGKIFLVP
jgi:phage repressor protein C with HTH and peptisase S24 domain